MQALTIEGLESCPLEESATLLKFTLRAARAGSWAWDLGTGEVYWSEEFHHLVGTSPGAFQPSYEAWVRTIHPQDKERAVREMQAALEARREIDIEFRVVRPDGVTRWMSSKGQTLYSRSGEPLRMVGVTFDVTERKRAEEELRQREQELAIIADGVPALISYVDKEQRYQFNNRMYEEWFGQPREEIQGRFVGEILGGAAYEDIRPHIEAALAGREARFERRIDYQDAGSRYIEARYVPHATPEGEVLGFFALVHDITELKRVEAALRESEERLRVATQAAGVGVWTWDIATDEVFWTRECYLVMGVEDFGGTLDDFRRSVHPEDLEEVWAAVGRAIDHRQPYWAEFRIVWPSGEVRWVLNHGRADYDAAGRPLRMLGIVSDITQRKRVEEALKSADRRKDEFLATLAHELRNPLAPIRNAVEVMRLLGPSNSQLQRMREVIERQTHQLTRLVDDLLDVSRIGQGKIVLHKERLDVAVIVERAVETSRALIEAGGHRLTVSVPSEPLPLQGDLVRLVQVLSNLLNNAAKYTEKGGNIGLTAARRGGDVEIRVTDDGIGIQAETLPYVFDLFAQGDRALPRAQGGLGIGLTLVRNLVEMHGGTVQAASAGPGQGSEILVLLPLLPGDPSRA